MSNPDNVLQSTTSSGPTTKKPHSDFIVAPLDPSMYKLEKDEAAFFKQVTGIKDDEELKQHILRVQTEAYEVFPYPCIRRFGFTSLKISHLPSYGDLLKIGKEHDAVLLDIGCCFGNDVRKAVADGYPAKNVIASDIEPAFWQLGHSLFKTTQESFPATFIAGDAFDPVFLNPTPPIYAPLHTPLPVLSEVQALTELHGRISAIHASSLFHLFDEDRQLALARGIASLLAPHPGAMIFGSHAGAPEKGHTYGTPGASGKLITMFCHSPESWKELWKSIFEPEKIEIDARLEDITPSHPEGSQPSGRWYFLVWSVKRL